LATDGGIDQRDAADDRQATRHRKGSSMTGAQREIYAAATTAQAHLLKNVLERQGIRAFIANEALQIAEGKLPMGTPTAPRVLVAECDAEEARQIAISFDRSSRESADVDDEDATPSGRPWPRCPSCSRPRHTSCPYCGTAGANFQPGYAPAPESATRAMLVLCGTCDEPFEPEFTARCEWCGYRFADGRELPVPRWSESEMSWRAWIVILGLLAVLAGALALFGYIAPRT
jgi:hypothetical protein